MIVTGSVTSRGSVETVADVDRNTCPEFGHVNTGVRDPVEAARDQQGARVVSATDR